MARYVSLVIHYLKCLDRRLGSSFNTKRVCHKNAGTLLISHTDKVLPPLGWNVLNIIDRSGSVSHDHLVPHDPNLVRQAEGAREMEMV